ncbi:Membrane-bound lytic murein transglycosylase F precursor [Luteitalea pratensis]|uniref:Membrane-bound lytic murein transglycosylase F n=1 Tax=Luteitalea pratensis TaxID=1855912 RepID=A0A143PMJ4_LUTPR|nr:transporter substrate-binding domain-containing protein [Luteitalea pratensis]AMY08989.1 Membrane-bound lytic murein transglycosylase F precursor [Luteitalea pratensis]
MMLRTPCFDAVLRPRTRLAIGLLLAATSLIPAACSRPSAPASGDRAAGSNGTPLPLQDLKAAELLQLNARLTGDFDQMQGRRFVRALVPYGRTYYFLDGATQRGLAFDVLTEFERELAKSVPKGTVPPKIVIIPTSRDRLLTALAEGYGDIAVGGFTVTEARRAQVDFSDPTKTGIREIVVTAPGIPAVTRIQDLSGRQVHVRKSSSYYEDLVALNAQLAREGLAPVQIEPADELLEDEDLLEMTDAGIVPMTVVKDATAQLWTQLYDHVTVHQDVALRTDAATALAIRKGAPVFRGLVNDFVRTHRTGTTFGNVVFNRYFRDASRLQNPTAAADLARFRALVQYFQKYGAQYDMDWLLIVSQAYQESQLDHSRRSRAGAVGVMQVRPATARDKNVGIANVRTIDGNIHAGTKYLRFMMDHYFANAPMDRLNKGLFALASYNAGPARVAGLRDKAKEMGLDPNVWFRNVEVVAGREIGRETVDYVSNIYKYYTAYKAVAEQRAARERSRPAAAGSR